VPCDGLSLEHMCRRWRFKNVDAAVMCYCRLNASVMAVKNCRRKAVELAQAVNARLGPVVAVREDFCHQSNDIPSPANDVSSDQNEIVSLHDRLRKATLHITAKATVTFQLQCHKMNIVD